MKKTLLDIAYEQHDLYQARYLLRMVDVNYYTKKVKLAKNNTQDKIDQQNNLKTAVSDLENDRLLMDSFKEIISQLEQV